MNLSSWVKKKALPAVKIPGRAFKFDDHVDQLVSLQKKSASLAFGPQVQQQQHIHVKVANLG